VKRIQFKADSESEVIAVANGDYRREFKRAEQPFEVEDAEAEMLKRTGHFEEEPQRLLPPAPEPDNN
jgi:hypothetical protein